MVKEIKELRVQIDGLAQLTKELKPLENCILIDERVGINANSKQINKATDSLFLAKAWLGKVLGEIGEDSPYPKDGKRKTVKDIEPTAEQSDISNPNVTIEEPKFLDGKLMKKYVTSWSELNHIEKVDWLRQEIQKVSNDYENLWFTEHENLLGFLYIVVHQHLSEARDWLVFELERIREEGN